MQNKKPENGVFRHKTSFTAASNSMTRDCTLPLMAKGLYLLIQSWISYDAMQLTKGFLQEHCVEGEKAFSTAWNALKTNGYLKIHAYPAEHGHFRYEYELLDEPDLRDGVFLYRYDNRGEVSSTNLTGSQPELADDHHPQNGVLVKSLTPPFPPRW